MYIFRLGIISTLLSETLVNSFTTGAAVYVAISQIKNLLGLKLHDKGGYFKLIFVCIGTPQFYIIYINIGQFISDYRRYI